MFTQQSYQKIFVQKYSNKNQQTLKKFVIFPFHKSIKVKPYTSLIIKNCEYLTTRKNYKKPQQRYQRKQKSLGQIIQDRQKIPLSSIFVKSKIVTPAFTSSFIQNTLNKNNFTIITQNQLFHQLTHPQQKKPPMYPSSSPTPTSSPHPQPPPSHKLSSIITSQYLHELPTIKKRMSIPQKKCKYISMQSRNSALIKSTKDNNKTLQQQQHILFQSKQIKSIRQCPQTPNKISSPNKSIISQQLQSLQKGYLSYDTNAYQFVQTIIKHLPNQTKIRRKITGISADNYLAINRHTLSIILQKNSNQQIEIASLTKIMTCYLTILVCQKFNIIPKNIIVRVSDRAQDMPGTSAQLQAGDILTLYDLLFALMLPSGNDASIVIADTVGKIIQKNKKNPSRKSYFQTFIAHMNLLAKQIGIEQTYQNSSGLPLNPNFSSPKAIGILTALALKNSQFYQIVNCKDYQLQIKNQRFGLVRKLNWKNTNKLLWKGWQGVKTGTTQSAGHCLMSCKDDFIICVFNCQSLSKRFSQCIRIYQYLSQQKIHMQIPTSTNTSSIG